MRKPSGQTMVVVVAVVAACAAIVLVRSGATHELPPRLGAADAIVARAEALPAEAGVAMPAVHAAASEGRDDATPGSEPLGAKALALLADPDAYGLEQIIAEVVAVGAVQDTLLAPPHGTNRVEYRVLTLRCLEDDPENGIRKYGPLRASLCPAVSEATHQCSTPLGAVQQGDIRAFVLDRGDPVANHLLRLLEPRARWIVLAGPPLPASVDPVLAKLPRPLAAYLGRPVCNVFRGRVRDVRRAPSANERAAGGSGAASAVVGVLEPVSQGGRLPLRERVRVVEVATATQRPAADVVAGAEYWFATEDFLAFQVLIDFAPAR